MVVGPMPEACLRHDVHDQMANGGRFRVLNIVDDVTRECQAAIPDTSISGVRVARELMAQNERHLPLWHAAQASSTHLGWRR